jgi:uncharacterized protein YkwD
MIRMPFLAVAALAFLAACATTPESTVGPDGQPLPRAYKIRSSDTAKIQFGTLDEINALRQAKGYRALELNSQLTAAAATHSRDMSVQNRPWNFSSDGSSPIERVARTGYLGEFRGEAIRETFENEGTTLEEWLRDPTSRRIILDPDATDMGFSWYQEKGGKIWWTLVTGRRGAGSV